MMDLNYNNKETTVMSDLKAPPATLSISMYVDCPDDDCGNNIDIMDSRDTNGVDHNDDGNLLRQMFPSNGDNEDFVCYEVTCSDCKTTFDVKRLEW